MLLGILVGVSLMWCCICLRARNKQRLEEKAVEMEPTYEVVPAERSQTTNDGGIDRSGAHMMDMEIRTNEAYGSERYVARVKFVSHVMDGENEVDESSDIVNEGYGIADMSNLQSATHASVINALSMEGTANGPGIYGSTNVINQNYDSSTITKKPEASLRLYRPGSYVDLDDVTYEYVLNEGSLNVDASKANGSTEVINQDYGSLTKRVVKTVSQTCRPRGYTDFGRQVMMSGENEDFEIFPGAYGHVPDSMLIQGRTEDIGSSEIINQTYECVSHI